MEVQEESLLVLMCNSMLHCDLLYATSRLSKSRNQNEKYIIEIISKTIKNFKDKVYRDQNLV